jgi:neutral ceramidase
MIRSFSLTLLFFTTALTAKLEIGTAIVDITPQEWPLVLRGAFFPKPAEKAHDPLHVRAMALRNGEGKAVIVIVDTLGLGREVLDEVKARAAEKTGWCSSEMLIAATHTHSAPSNQSFGPPPQVAYGKLAQDGMVEAIVKAVANLQPGSLGWGEDAVPDEVYNRRWYMQEGKMPLNPFGELDKVKMNPNRNHITKPAGPTDPTVAVLYALDAKRKPLGMLANYPLHYVGGINYGERMASADYFGEFCRVVPWRLRAAGIDQFVPMLSNGACGDINNIDFTGERAPREPFEQCRIVAAKVADAAWRATRDMEFHSDIPIGIQQREVPLEWRKPSPDLLHRSEKINSMTPEEQAELPQLEPLYARRVINMTKLTGKADCLVQAMRVGDLAIVTFPFETFVEIGLEIKSKSPFKQTIVIELANGSYGYLPTPKHHELGGYETWLGTNKVQKDASEILTRNLLEMLNDLHQN